MKASCQDPHTAEIDRLFLEIALISGYALSRWKQGIDFCIPKKEDSIRVTKLRTIILFECDFNHLNKIVARRLMAHAESLNTIAVEQYGSRKKKSSILHAINKQLTFEILHQEKSSPSLMVLDAVSCYDRISAPIASLYLRRQGAPNSIVRVMVKTLADMRHYVRTATGDSSNFYSQEQDNIQLHGILQGNGAGPMIWAMVSTPILEKMRAEGYGIPIVHPETSESFQVTAFSFVDDADFVQRMDTTFAPSTKAQANFDTWVDSLMSTGGDVSGEKSTWYAMIHSWRNNQWHLLSAKNALADLFKTLPNGTREMLTRRECSEATKALGIYFAPDGNMKAQVEYLTNKARTWAEQIRCGFLRRQEAWYSLTTCIMKSIDYSLPATTMTFQETESIMKPILSTGLSKSGICQKISRNVVYSSTKYQGFGITHPFFTQGATKLAIFLLPKPDLPLLSHALHTNCSLT
jgi:Reverse transcriptase (RNA-dependent DNA polymerase)